MKIVYVHKDINVDVTAGGINTVYLWHIKELAKLGHEIHVITSRDGSWNLDAIRHVVSKDQEMRNKEIEKILNEIDPDIIDVFSWGAELLDYVKKPHKAKIIMRADIPMKFYGKENLDEQMALYCDKVISISKWCDFEWSSVIGENTTIIPHGAEEIKYEEKDKIPNSVVWVGKQTDMKGFDILYKLPKEFFDDFNLTVICAKTIYTKDDDIKKLQDMGVIVKQSLSQEDYNEILQRSEYVLSTARKEGFCIAVLETMQFGAIPVIPFWIGGTTDFVDETNGIVYKNLDDCYKQMKELKNNKEEKKRKELNSKLTVKKYNWHDIALESLKVYEGVLNEN